MANITILCFIQKLPSARRPGKKKQMEERENKEHGTDAANDENESPIKKFCRQGKGALLNAFARLQPEPRGARAIF